MVHPSYGALLSAIEGEHNLAIAFSGGVDSTLLLFAAREAVGAGHVLALTAVTPYMVRQEIGDAVALAGEMGVRHELVEMDMPPGMEANPTDRCYQCKGRMYQLLQDAASALGHRTLLDASNLDDVERSRPALKALSEMGIRTPLIECGIDKHGVRALSQSLGLPSWSKPSNACLLTRLRHDQPVSMRDLQRIEEAERMLQQLGFESVRVRAHGGLARIEVAAEQRLRLMERAEEIDAGLRSLGFQHVCADLSGYRQGSMSEAGC
jgi:uncharacterized protein